jgi:hypothetical protein
MKTIEQLAAQCRDALKAKPGAAGRKDVCALLAETLRDAEFVAAYLTEDNPERRVLHEDAELGFCICAHHFQGTKVRQPHGHGPTWAIYGQGRAETIMSDFELVEAPSEGKRGKARRLNTYTLTPGTAHLYDIGELHGLRRERSAHLIRIEGQNLEKIKREDYEEVQ